MSKTVHLEMWVCYNVQRVSCWGDDISVYHCTLQMINPLYTAPERQIDNPLYEAGAAEE